MWVQMCVSSEIKQLHFHVLRKLAHKNKASGSYKQCGNFKSMFFSFSPYSLLLIV